MSTSDARRARDAKREAPRRVAAIAVPQGYFRSLPCYACAAAGEDQLSCSALTADARKVGRLSAKTNQDARAQQIASLVLTQLHAPKIALAISPFTETHRRIFKPPVAKLIRKQAEICKQQNREV